MATMEASSPSSSVTAGDGTTINPPSSSATNANERTPPSASSAIDFLSLCHRLKTTKRARWVKRDAKNPESIADHMYRMLFDGSHCFGYSWS